MLVHKKKRVDAYINSCCYCCYYCCCFHRYKKTLTKKNIISLFIPLFVKSRMNISHFTVSLNDSVECQNLVSLHIHLSVRLNRIDLHCSHPITVPIQFLLFFLLRINLDALFYDFQFINFQNH